MRAVVGTAASTAVGTPYELTAQARAALVEALECVEVGERFRLAHIAALRVAAAVIAARGRPASTQRRLLNLWTLLDRVAPEYADWSAYFAAGATLRAAVEAGSPRAVSDRQADDEVRAAGQFLAVVERSLGLLAA